MLPLQMIPVKWAFMVLISLPNACVSIAMTHTSDLRPPVPTLAPILVPYPQNLKPQTYPWDSWLWNIRPKLSCVQGTVMSPYLVRIHSHHMRRSVDLLNKLINLGMIHWWTGVTGPTFSSPVKLKKNLNLLVNPVSRGIFEDILTSLNSSEMWV